MTYVELVAGNVRAELSRRNITQAEIAKVLDMSKAQLSSRLNNRVEFKLSELETIAKHLQVPLEVLTNREQLTK